MGDAAWPSDPIERALMEDDQRRSFVRGSTGRDPGEHPLAAEVRRLRAEHAAAVAAARMDERQRAAEAIASIRAGLRHLGDSEFAQGYRGGFLDAMNAVEIVLAQPAPTGADALAEMLAEAERNGIERVAQWHMEEAAQADAWIARNPEFSDTALYRDVAERARLHRSDAAAIRALPEAKP